MKHTSWIALAVVLAMLAAGAVAWRLRTVQSGLAATQSIPASTGESIRAQPSSVALPPPKAGMPMHLRRLLITRLGRPRVLSLRRVRTVRNPRYAGVACGEVAWGDTRGEARAFKRFVASKHIVHLDGTADFPAIWNKVCTVQ